MHESNNNPLNKLLCAKRLKFDYYTTDQADTIQCVRFLPQACESEVKSLMTVTIDERKRVRERDGERKRER